MSSEQAPQHLPIAEKAQNHEAASLNDLREYRLSTIESLATEGVVRDLESEDSLERNVFASQDWGRLAEHGTPYIDTNIASPTERRLLNAIGASQGLEGDELFKKTQSLAESEKISFQLGAGVSFDIHKYTAGKNRVSYQINVDSETPKEEKEAALQSFHEKVRLSTSKLELAQEEVKDAVLSGEKEAYSNEVFSFGKNADDIIAHLSHSRIANVFSSLSNEKLSPTMSRRKVIEALYALPSHYAGESQDSGAYRAKEGIHFDEHGQLVKVLVGTHRPGVYIALRAVEKVQGDLSEQPLTIGVEMDAKEIYTELDYNGIYREETLPFLETPAASEILGSFDEQGLALNGRLRDSFAEVGRIERRYGHGYSEITREVAKLVNDRNRGYSSLFEDDGAVSDKIRSMSEATDPAAKAVIDMLKDTVDRVESAEDMQELPVSKSRVELRDGGCKDAEVYIADSNEISHAEDGSPLFLQSTYKRKSVLTLQPTLLSGVRIPAGALLAVENDGYLLMRLTGYSFTPEEAAVVFGAQEAENRQNSARYGNRSFSVDKMIKR